MQSSVEPDDTVMRLHGEQFKSVLNPKSNTEIQRTWLYGVDRGVEHYSRNMGADGVSMCKNFVDCRQEIPFDQSQWTTLKNICF